MRGAGDKVNVGVIGVGGRGKAHVRRFAGLADARVAAVCDINTAQTERGVQIAQGIQGTKPKVYQDLRRLYEDKDIDAVSIATPNHWHALATIWACQAGKDVYVEKPASHDIFEGQQMIAAARKYNRMVQVGMQSRSMPHMHRAMELLRADAIGEVYMTRGICFKRRKSIGHTPVEPAPPGVDWDLFLGPAPFHQFSKNRFAYNWHWFWDTGNGDIGNQGIHEMDIARWALSRDLPKAVVSTGGKYVYKDDQETPNTQIATLDYGDAEIVFEVRGLNTGGEGSIAAAGPNFVGDQFFGSKGFISIDDRGFQTYLGDKREPGEQMKADRSAGDPSAVHMENFLKAVKSRRHTDLNADIATGVSSVILVHIANISYRLGRLLAFDPATQRFLHDDEANSMIKANYRPPFVIPERV